jgi:hypothetical protein
MVTAIDQVTSDNQFSLTDPIDFAPISNSEEMFMVSGGDPQSSKTDEINDWSMVSATSGELTGKLFFKMTY